MRFEVERTQALFHEGLKLCALVERRVRLDIEMFSRGGMEVLRRIEAQGYDTLTQRPAIPKRRQMAMLLGRLIQNLTARR
jgi:phytoene/squalene synthetase